MSRRAQRITHVMGRWRLANRMACSMIIVAAIAIIGLFFALNRADREEIEALQTATLHNNAQELARGLDRLVGNELGRMRNLALSRSVVDFSAARPDQRSALFTPTLADFTNFRESSPFYRAVLLLDRNGEVLISTEGSYVGQQFAQSAFFQQANQGQAYMSDPGISSLAQQAVIWLAAPVVTLPATQSTPDGVVAVALSPEWLWTTVEQFQVGQNGYAMVVDQHGIRLAHGRDRHYVFRSLVPLAPATWAALQTADRFGPLSRLNDTGSDALMRYVQSEPLPARLIDRQGGVSDRVYYSGARMQQRTWTVLVMLSEREVLAPATRVTLRGVYATLLVAALLALTVWWIARRIVRPVPQLTQAAAKIAQGDLSTPVAVQGSSELHTLAESFETMRERLRASRDELAHWATTLESRVAQRSQELAALSALVAFASRTQSRGELLHTALAQALRVMGAEMGGIWMAERTGTLQLVAQSGLGGQLGDSLATFAPGEGLLGQVQMQGQPMVLNDISESLQLARVVVREHGLHAFAAVPLRIHGRTLGVMGIFSRSHAAFSPEAIALAASIAQQIALTLDNLALVEQTQTQAHAVASLRERERIAGEIHDSIAQTLSYLYLQTDRLANDVPRCSPDAVRDRLAQMQDVLAAATDEVRQFIARLHEVAPPPAALRATLHNEVDRLAAEVPVQVTLRVAPDDLLVSASTGTELARIVGEATRNAHHHGHATLVEVSVQQDNGVVRLCISDNGAGFNPDQPPRDNRSHFGLSVMRARAARIGGELRLVSTIGVGTRIEVWWSVGAPTLVAAEVQ